MKGGAAGVRRGASALRRAGNAATAWLLERLGPGRPLEQRQRLHLEGVLGEDLRGVRVVRGPDAGAAVASVGAVALAAGETVVLGPDAESSSAREEMLAHEVIHVVQQRRHGAVNTVGEPDAAAERLAERTGRIVGSRQARPPILPCAAGPVPAIQRQMRKDVLTRAQAQQRITQYLEGQLRKQGGQTIAVTAEVKGMLRRIFLNDFSGLLRLDTYLSRTVFPSNAADLAAEIARLLPDYLEQSRLAHLEASTGPGPTPFERVKEAIQKTEPYESPEQQESKWSFERMAKEARRGEETFGPYGLDMQRAFNVGRELTRPKTAPPPRVRARSYATVERAIATIDRDALIPAEAKGTTRAGDFADAGEVARSIAADLDIAQQRGDDVIGVHLGPAYTGVGDATALATEVARIIRLVREALPHKASRVARAEIHFGRRIMRVVTFTGNAD